MIYPDDAINRICCADCLDVLKKFPDECFDMILSDPPYGRTSCKWDSIIPLDLLWKELCRIIKPNCAIVMTASQPFTSVLIMSNLEMFRYTWVWDKRFAANFGNAKIQPLKRHEDVVIFGNKKSPRYYPQMMKREKPIKIGKNSKNSNDRGFLTKNALNNPEYDNKTYDYKYPESIQLFSIREDKKRYHPTQKPIGLFEYLIKTYTQEDELVLDFAIGSGTTAIACINTNRKFIGIEKEKKYCEIARSRLNEMARC